ncbi:ABC transporter substrate-binding protein [Paenibacillus allorhizosphaerae]|uniref:Extracellular solute-binding protein n=1 Tax=Paenibacillus allorhizosphaerae TaxID=2849866 RepID=A0ABM8VUE2_9BACL|nr:extracellular solute-binding protein [Paenibacillus allorhizosphaerae]CAG7658752.1 hypothetical protein PAECIP111802_07155 [Paenibacillus allorhizosphaerae]
MSHRIIQVLFIIYILFVAGIISGCSANKEGAAGKEAQGPNSAVVEPKPVTLRVGQLTYTLPKQDFETLVAEPVKKKFPHITLEYVDKLNLNEMAVAGTLPDLIWDGVTLFARTSTLDIPLDMAPLAKKFNFDFNIMESSLVDNVKMLSNKGEMFFFPLYNIFFVTHFNKNIFDKFGISYPKDNMTWEEMLQLAKRFNVMEGGLQYQGMNMNGLNRIPMQTNLPNVDRATDRAVIQSNPGWKNLFELLKPAYLTPEGKALQVFSGKAQFLEKQNLALFPDLTLLGGSNVDLEKAVGQGLEWDMVTYPVFKENPVGVGGFFDGFIISKSSKHPEEAFQVLMHLASEEVQLKWARVGKMTVLNKDNIKQQILAESPLANGKNLKPIFALNKPKAYPSTIYDSTAVSTYTSNGFTPYVQGKKDLNTVLREAEEILNKKIDMEKESKR